MRLQRYLAQAGLGARRRCEKLIRAGRVKVDGQTAQLGQTVVPGKSDVRVDGRRVAPVSERVVIVFNKPAGVLSACHRSREQGPLVTELVRSEWRLFPCGRLDKDSEGLLILTNDGDLAYRLTHPRFAKEKEYEVVLDRDCTETQVSQLVRGVELEDGLACAKLAERISASRLRVVLTQGRKRQLRRMLEALGLGVRRLIRTRIGAIRLGRLGPGQWRRLREEEIRKLTQQRWGVQRSTP